MPGAVWQLVPHTACPAGHWHDPPVHDWLEIGHAFPQLAQLLDVPRGVSQPLPLIPSQSAVPPTHAYWQLEPAQLTAELGRAAHANPHALQ